MNQHIVCLQQACDELAIPYSQIGKSPFFINVKLAGKNNYFIGNEVPFNSAMVARICEDKAYTSELLDGLVTFPKHISFLDPDCDERYRPLVRFKNSSEISGAILSQFELPVVLKPNRGLQGVNIFKCENDRDIQQAIAAIFNKQSPTYDYLLLAQTYIPIEHEYRVTVFNQKIVLVYEKDFSQATFVGNLSPFHWEGTIARVTTDPNLRHRLAAFIQPIYQRLDLMYGGLDIAVDKTGQLWLFEINTKPAYTYLVRDNGPRILVDLYKEILQTTAAELD